MAKGTKALAAARKSLGIEPGEPLAGVPVENPVDEMVEQEGAAPVDSADDHTTQFDRRVERLTEIALEAEFTGGTLVGDIRDALLDQYKNRPKPWSQLSADEMRDVNKGLETVAKTLIRKIVLIVAEEDDVSVPATLKGYSVKGDAFQLKIEASGDEDVALELFRMDGHDVVILRADAKRFHGQRKDAEVIEDQASLAFADDKAKDDHPDDDSDLAGDDDDEIETTPEGFGSDDGVD